MAELNILKHLRPTIDVPSLRPFDPEEAVRDAARRQGLDENLAHSVASTENASFDPRAVSPKGAIGIMQLMPKTAKELGVDPHDPIQNIEGGTRHLKQLLDRYEGDSTKAVAAYNAGAGRIDRGVYPAETRQYVKNVFEKLGGGGAIISAEKPSGIMRHLQDAGAQPERPRADVTEPSGESGVPSWLSTVGGAASKSLLKTVGGVDLMKLWEQEVRPRAQKGMIQGKQPSWSEQVALELTKIGPEAVEFFTSPMGLALTAAHIVPQTRPFAAAADVVLGGLGLASSIPTTIRAAETKDPKDVARAIIDVASAYPLFKAGKATIHSLGKGFESGPIQAETTLSALKEAAPDDWKAVLGDLEAAKTHLQKFEQRLYATPAVRLAASVLNIPKPKLLSAADELVQRRSGFLAWQDWRADKLALEMKNAVPAEDRTIQKLGYVLQGSATADQVGLSPAARAIVPALQKFAQEDIDMLREAYGKDIPLQDAEHYLAQIWDFRKDADKGRIATTLMRDPFLKKRVIGSYKEGIEQHDLTPKFDDVVDVVTTRHRVAARAIANQEFANTLKNTGLLLSQDEASKLGLSHWADAVEAPALYRAAYGGKTPQGDPVFRYAPPKVHPEIQMAVNSIFAQPSKSPTLAALDQVRSFSKMNRVGWSLFHNTALTEQAQGIYATRSPAEVLKSVYFLNPETYKGLRSGVWEVLGRESKDAPPMLRMDPQVAETMLKAGVVYRSPEYERGIINWMRHFGERSGPIGKTLGAPMRALGNGEYIWNKSMWDYYAQGQMAHAFERLNAEGLNRLGASATAEEIFAMQRANAKHINNVFGMENLQNLLMTPNTRRAANFALFAPMWTLSNIRTPLAGLFEGELQWDLTKRWVAGAATSWFLTTQLANYALSSYYNTEDRHGNKGGHWTWDNPGAPLQVAGRMLPGVSDNVVNISAGYNPDGSQRFIRFGKGFREPFLWMLEPIKTLGGKLSIPLQWAMVTMTGSQPGGFQVVDKRARPAVQAAQWGSYTAEQFLPFATSQATERLKRAAMPQAFREPTTTGQFFGMPTRKGLTVMGAVDAIEEALRQGQETMIDGILVAAKANNIDPTKVIEAWSSRRRQQLRQERGPLFKFSEFGEPDVAIPSLREEK